MRSRSTHATVLALAFGAGLLACSSDSDNGGSGGTGGSSGTGGATGGRGGSTGGSSAGSGGSTGGSTAGSGGSTGGSTAGSGGSTAGSGGSSAGSGGSSGSGGSTGGSGGSGTDAAADKSGDIGGGSEMGSSGGPFKITVTGLDMSPRFNVPVFPRTASNPMNMSPPIEWSGLPADTKSIAVSMIDTGTTGGMNVTPGSGTKAHWVMWDIPATVTALKPNLPHTTTYTDPMGAKTTRFAGGTGYFGPGAPSINIYVITVWALNVDTLAGAQPGAASQSIYGMLASKSIAKVSFVAVGKQGGL